MEAIAKDRRRSRTVYFVPQKGHEVADLIEAEALFGGIDPNTIEPKETNITILTQARVMRTFRRR